MIHSRLLGIIVSLWAGVVLAQQTGARQIQAQVSGQMAGQVERYIQLYLRSFQLLDTTGAEAPALLPGQRTSPFAALIEFSAPNTQGAELSLEMNLCTATHLRPGDVVSHGGCLPNATKGGPAWAYLIYYDDSGTKRSFQVTSYNRLEEPFDSDKIVIALPSEFIARWPALLGNAYPAPDAVWEDPDAPLTAAVWAYDALNLRPDIVAKLPKRNTSGMVFNPRLNCKMSAVPTSVQWVSADRKVLLSDFKIDAGGKARNVVYLDSCNYPFIQGNLGALITRQAIPGHVAGIYHAGLSRGTFWRQIVDAVGGNTKTRLQQKSGHHFYYRSYDGKTYEIFPQRAEEADQGLLAMGRPFQFLHSIFPEIEEEEEEASIQKVKVTPPTPKGATP